MLLLIDLGLFNLFFDSSEIGKVLKIRPPPVPVQLALKKPVSRVKVDENIATIRFDLSST